MASNSSLFYPTLSDKLLAFSRPRGKCRLWTHPLNENGYAYVTYETRRTSAHRASLEVKLGRPIKAGAWACHARECPNKHCIAEDHLYEGTPQSNRDDDAALGKIQRGEQVPQSVLTSAQVRSIRKDTRLLREIAADYGITEGHVSEIRHRKKWAHLK